jgi:hypothetical protein
MKNLTFIIPYQKDSEERFKNLLWNIQYLHSHFNSPILISTTKKDYQDIKEWKDVEITFIDDIEGSYRTLLGNEGYKHCKTKYFCLTDVDVFTEYKHYISSYCALDDYDFSIPYYTKMYDVKFNNLWSKDIIKYEGSIGGLFFGRLDKILEVGGENINMKGWGYEDFERVERCKRLLYNIHQTNYDLYHLYHPESKNPEQVKLNHDYLNKLYRFKYHQWYKLAEELKINFQ